jgi:hypothetical protein
VESTHTMKGITRRCRNDCMPARWVTSYRCDWLACKHIR